MLQYPIKKQLTNLRKKTSITNLAEMLSLLKWRLVRISKIGSYESPYSVTGTILLTGVKDETYGLICTDKNNGTWKVV